MMHKSSEYKQHGFIEQKQKGFYSLRIRTRAGNMTTEQLRKVADLADKYAKGQVHFTTRQSVEMPWVPEVHYRAMMQEIKDAGLLWAVCGQRMRTIVACPGAAICRFGLVDTVSLAGKLDEIYVGQELPSKTKLGISGCANSCGKPQENDIGLQGVIEPVLGEGCIGCGVCSMLCKAQAVELVNDEPVFNKEKCIGCGRCMNICPERAIEAKYFGYNLYVGGKIGRFPQLGVKVVEAIAESDVVSYLEAVLAAYRSLAQKGERVANVINRVGLELFTSEIVRQYKGNICESADGESAS